MTGYVPADFDPPMPAMEDLLDMNITIKGIPKSKVQHVWEDIARFWDPRLSIHIYLASKIKDENGV